MPINLISVTLTVNPTAVACPPPGGVFTVTATVAGRATGRGGSYDIGIYDEDLIRDDFLDGSAANGVGAGPFRRQHTFFLECSDSCGVVGKQGSSGESTAEIYAWVNGGRNVTAKSRTIEVRCTSQPLPPPPPKRRQATPKKKVETALVETVERKG